MVEYYAGRGVNEVLCRQPGRLNSVCDDETWKRSLALEDGRDFPDKTCKGTNCRSFL